MLAVCDHHDRRGEPLALRALGARFHVDAARLSSVVARLEGAGLLLAVGTTEAAHVPGRTLDQITVLEVLRMFTSHDVEAARADTLGTLFANLDVAITATFKAVTFHDLIVDERRRRNREPEPVAPPAP